MATGLSEALRCVPKDAGPPADVYSLASTTVFALRGGELPRGYYRDPSSTIAGLGYTPALVRVLTQAMAVDPGDRFSSAGAFVAAIEEATVDLADPLADLADSPIVKRVAEKRPRPKRRDAPLVTLDDDLLSFFRTPQGERKLLWCEIPAGIGWIGSPDSEKGRHDDEGPRHQVEILEPFWLASVPVTNAQYAAFDSKKPFYKWAGVPEDQLVNHPRVEVTWQEAMSFCNWLAKRGFEGARLQCPRSSKTAFVICTSRPAPLERLLQFAIRYKHIRFVFCDLQKLFRGSETASAIAPRRSGALKRPLRFEAGVPEAS